MSHTEVERFVADVANNQDLLQELSDGGMGLEELVETARKRGYDFTAEEAKAFAGAQADDEISDTELDQVAGGTMEMSLVAALNGVALGFGQG